MSDFIKEWPVLILEKSKFGNDYQKNFYKQADKEHKISYLNIIMYSLTSYYIWNNKNNKFGNYVQILMFVRYLKKNVSQDILESCKEYEKLPSIKQILKKIISVENIYRKNVKHKVFTILGIKIKIRINND